MVGFDAINLCKSCRFSLAAKQNLVTLIGGIALISFVVYIISDRSNKHRQDAGLNPYAEDSQQGVCRETFNKSVYDNLMVLKQYPVGEANEYMWKLDGNITSPDRIRKFPVIVTAFDWQYYPQSMGLFESIHKRLMRNWNNRGKVKVIFYDLGLTKRQLRIMRMKCQCEIRPFPFDEFPPHVKMLRTYAFKPIIMQMLLAEYGFVWWADTSLRFQTGDIDKAIQYTKENSVLFFVIDNMGSLNTIPTLTDGQTFEYLGEDVCKFRKFSETMATTVAFHYDELSRTIVRAWVVCALNEKCIAPEGSKNKRICKIRGSRDGECHRFDQSVLSILTRRIYHRANKYPQDDSLKTMFKIQRATITHYFEKCSPLLKCLA